MVRRIARSLAGHLLPTITTVATKPTAKWVFAAWPTALASPHGLDGQPCGKQHGHSQHSSHRR